jgi:hexameric tyrosine-coordinated heme protein (HTHP)
MRNTLKIIVLSSMLVSGFVSNVQADDHKKSKDYMPSLITETPLEGRMLAITMVRKTMGTIQRNADIKKDVRAKYQDDPELLMRAAELVAIEFKTIARANNYWRD